MSTWGFRYLAQGYLGSTHLTLFNYTFHLCVIIRATMILHIRLGFKFDFRFTQRWLAHTRTFQNCVFLLLSFNLLLCCHLFTLGIFYKNICHQMPSWTIAAWHTKIIKHIRRHKNRRCSTILSVRQDAHTFFLSTQFSLCWVNKRFEPNGKFHSVFISLWRKLQKPGVNCTEEMWNVFFPVCLSDSLFPSFWSKLSEFERFRELQLLGASGV